MFIYAKCCKGITINVNCCNGRLLKIKKNTGQHYTCFTKAG